MHLRRTQFVTTCRSTSSLRKFRAVKTNLAKVAIGDSIRATTHWIMAPVVTDTQQRHPRHSQPNPRRRWMTSTPSRRPQCYCLKTANNLVCSPITWPICSMTSRTAWTTRRKLTGQRPVTWQTIRSDSAGVRCSTSTRRRRSSTVTSWLACMTSSIVPVTWFPKPRPPSTSCSIVTRTNITARRHRRRQRCGIPSIWESAARRWDTTDPLWDPRRRQWVSGLRVTRLTSGMTITTWWRRLETTWIMGWSDVWSDDIADFRLMSRRPEVCLLIFALGLYCCSDWRSTLC